ncbi:MAG: Nif3-like dinuclear metal center hexameric protein, partial [Gemmatimonadetes bacterium]|nr:Nif3-like dinuclear metal center hexameric protein [Gemmatimonadota bacterium]
MPSLDSIVPWLDALLRIRELPDYDGAVNGLQVQNGGTITRILAAVDASADSIAAAAGTRGTLLLVHHGLFWGADPAVTGRRYR